MARKSSLMLMLLITVFCVCFAAGNFIESESRIRHFFITAQRDAPIDPAAVSGEAAMENTPDFPAISKAGGGNTALPLNINTATAEELSTLPGMDIATARSIVAFRENYGDFLSIEEIIHVSGITRDIFLAVEGNICVGL